MNRCTVTGCSNIVRAKGLCSKHYERVRTHGDVNADNRRKELVFCSVTGCYTKAVANKLCQKHYARKFRHGSTDSLIPNYGQGFTVHKQGYIRIWTGTEYKMEHVLLAEKALGKPLPKGAVVHHFNEDPTDNKPNNLVICPDQEYHFLLHKRARELGYIKD